MRMTRITSHGRDYGFAGLKEEVPMDTDALQAEIANHPYWFHRMELGAGVVTPGRSDARRDKLPYFGLPEDLSGKRVLDIGCAEGFFSFEAERRGAEEVVAIDKGEAPGDNAARFRLCADALGSRLTIQSASVYELNPHDWGKFDVVFFFGVLYHLTDQAAALESIASVTAGILLLQTLTVESVALRNVAVARLYPEGVISGPKNEPLRDRSVLWIPNAECVRGLLERSGFDHNERLPTRPIGRRQWVADRIHPGRERQSWVNFRSTMPS